MFADLLRQWSGAYDIVIIDAPPLLDSPDALAAAPGTAGLLLVADLNSARSPHLERALTLAAMTAVPVLGCVLTRTDGWSPGADSAAASLMGRGRPVREAGSNQRTQSDPNGR